MGLRDLYRSILATLICMVASGQVYAGGDSGGGGDAISAQPNYTLGKKSIEEIISRLRPMARWELNGLRAWNICSGPCEKDPFQKARFRMVSQHDIVRNLIDNVRIEVLESAGCLSSENGKAVLKAASAHLPGTICFSLSELQKVEVSSHDRKYADRMLLALFFHELNHLMGGDELESVALQEAIHRGGVEIEGRSSEDAYYVVEYAYNDRNLILTDLSVLIKTLEENKDIKNTYICSMLSSLSTEFGLVTPVMLDARHEYLDNRILRRMSDVINGFCHDLKTIYYEHKNVITEYELELNIISNDSYDGDEDLRKYDMKQASKYASKTKLHHYVPYGDKQTLFIELNSLAQDIEQLVMYVKNMSVREAS